MPDAPSLSTPIAPSPTDSTIDIDPAMVEYHEPLAEAHPIYLQPTTDQIAARAKEYEEFKPDLEKIKQIKSERGPYSKANKHRGWGPRSHVPKERTIHLRYTAEDMGQEYIDLIIKRWKDHVPMEIMIKQINGRLVAEKRTPLSIPDLYAILTDQMHRGNILQRRKPVNEMTISKFSDFFKCWKEGGTLQQCLAAAEPFKNRYFIDKCFRSLMDRHRAAMLQEAQQRASDGAIGTIQTMAQFEKSLLKIATRQVIDDQACLVIPIKRIPAALRTFILSLPFGKQLLVEVDTQQKFIDQCKALKELSGPKARQHQASQRIVEPDLPTPKLDIKPPEDVNGYADEDKQPAPPPLESSGFDAPTSDFDEISLEDLMEMPGELSPSANPTIESDSSDEDPFTEEEV